MPVPKPTPTLPPSKALSGLPPWMYITGAALIVVIASAISFYVGLHWK